MEAIMSLNMVNYSHDKKKNAKFKLKKKKRLREFAHILENHMRKIS